jgi:hypothetical protein
MALAEVKIAVNAYAQGNPTDEQRRMVSIRKYSVEFLACDCFILRALDHREQHEMKAAWNIRRRLLYTL